MFMFYANHIRTYCWYIIVLENEKRKETFKQLVDDDDDDDDGKIKYYSYICSRALCFIWNGIIVGLSFCFQEKTIQCNKEHKKITIQKSRFLFFSFFVFQLEELLLKKIYKSIVVDLFHFNLVICFVVCLSCLVKFKC